jgi:hypothetical protein
MKKFDRNRARQLIMSDILSFYITSNWEPDQEHGKLFPANKGFTPAGYNSTCPASPGDLVILTSAPPSKWQIGWLREIERRQDNFIYYLIESLEDGSQMWWTNVGMAFMPRRELRERYHWTDRQFDFQKRWRKTTTTTKHSGMRPLDCIFKDNEVTLRLGIHWPLDDKEREGLSRTFSDYRKVTIPMMRAAIESMEEECSRNDH